MQTQVEINDLDQLVHGAEGIARVLNLVGEGGEPDIRRAYYLLERKYVDATKLGPRHWVSTKRRLLAGLVAPAKVA